MQRSGRALDAFHLFGIVGHVPVPVNSVRHAKTGAFPFADLGEQMQPSDLRVVRAVKPDARHPFDHRFVQVWQQASIVGGAGQQGQVGFGHAEGLIGAVGRAPMLDFLSVLPHHARDTPSFVHRTRQPIPGGGVFVVHAKACRLCMRVAGPGNLMRLGEFNGLRKVHQST